MVANFRRQLPKISELRPLMKFGLPDFDRKRGRLAKAADLWDLRRIAKRRTPRVAFDYVEGGANDELTLERNRSVLGNVEFVPRVLRDVSVVDLQTHIAGITSELPFGIAPTGFTRMMHAEGELAGTAAAARHGIPFSLSTMGTASIEKVANHASGAVNWFQLYLWKDREKSLKLIERASNAGYETLLVTVDTPIPGSRLRDRRNGMTIPPQLSLKTLLDASYRPEWWFNFLTSEPLTFATLAEHPGVIEDLIAEMFDPSLTLEDIQWLRKVWNGKLFVKGILTPEDALLVRDAGADGVVVSNHGGRQLDRAPVPLQVLPEIRKTVGPGFEIILDSGIMSGSDIVAALAYGANFTLIGRAYLYGLMAGGQSGVERAIQILRSEIEVSLGLLGISSIQEVGPEHVRQFSEAAHSGEKSQLPHLLAEKANL